MAMRATQEATFLILTALADGAQHGYGIITDVQQMHQAHRIELARIRSSRTRFQRLL